MDKKRLPGSRLIRRAKNHLRQGGVIAYPTESCFGLGGAPWHSRSLKRVLQAKKRPAHKGLIVIAANIDQLRPYVQPLSEADRQQLKQYWPGPFTFLLPASPRVLPLLRGTGNRKIAVRVTAHPQTAALCRQLKQPLVSTSANLAGRQPVKSYRSCRQALGTHVLTLPGNIGNEKNPSTIIDFSTKRKLR